MEFQFVGLKRIKIRHNRADFHYQEVLLMYSIRYLSVLQMLASFRGGLVSFVGQLIFQILNAA